MSVAKQSSNKSGQLRLGMTGMGHGLSRTSSGGNPASGADVQLHHPHPHRALTPNLFATTRSTTVVPGSRISSNNSESTVTNIEPANYEPLPLGGFMKPGERAADMPNPLSRSKSRNEVRSDPAHDSHSPLPPSEMRRAKTPAPGRTHADPRIHQTSTVHARPTSDNKVSEASTGPTSVNAEVTVDNDLPNRPIPFAPPLLAFGWAQKDKPRPGPARAHPPPIKNRSHANEHTDNTLIAEEHEEDYIVLLSDKENGKRPLERHLKGKQTREPLQEVGRKRRFSPGQQQSIQSPILRALPTDMRPQSHTAYDDEGTMDYYSNEPPVPERPVKRGRMEPRNVSTNPRDGPALSMRPFSPYDEDDHHAGYAPSNEAPVPAQQAAAYYDYDSQDGYERVPTPSLPDSDRVQYPSTSPVPEPKNHYDTEAYLKQHTVKFERMKQHWCECTYEQWMKGGPQLMNQFEEILSFVKTQLQRKIDLYTNLHSNLNTHDKTLDDRDVKLEEMKGSLANGTTGVVGSRERPIVL